MLPASQKVLSEDPCPRCLELWHEGKLPLEAVGRLPAGKAMAAMAYDGSGPCCDDCASADSMTRGSADAGLTWGMYRIAIGNDRREQYRLPGVPTGLVLGCFMRPSKTGDFEEQTAWLDRLKARWRAEVEAKHRADMAEVAESLQKTKQLAASSGFRSREMIPIGTINHPKEGELTVMYGRFAEDTVAVALLLINSTGQAYSKPAIFIDEDSITANLESGEFVLHHNANGDPAMLPAMLASGLFVDTGKTASYGRVIGQRVLKIREWADAAEKWWIARRAAESASVSA